MQSFHEVSCRPWPRMVRSKQLDCSMAARLMMDSNSVNSQRRYLVRVHDQQRKQIVNNKVVAIGADSSYADVFCRLELGTFKLLSASVLRYKNTPESDAADVEDLDEPIEDFERIFAGYSDDDDFDPCDA